VRYVTAIALIKGSLTAADYEDDAASDPRIDVLRDKMVCVEKKQWNRDYLNPKIRSVPCAVQVFFKDGSKTENVVVEFPLGHRRRRKEGVPQLEAKFQANLARCFPQKQQEAILERCGDRRLLEATPVHEFVDLFVV
jgi:2-methylcitrate dehydratase PrpD